MVGTFLAFVTSCSPNFPAVHDFVLLSPIQMLQSYACVSYGLKTQLLLETRYTFPWDSIWFSLGAVVTPRVLLHLQPTSLPHPLARPPAAHGNRGNRVLAVSRGSRALPVTKPTKEDQRMSLRSGQRRVQQQRPTATSRVAFTT